MEVRAISEEQKALWDGYLSEQSCGHFMQSHAWGVLRQAQGWAVDRLMVLENDRPVAAMMLLSKRFPFLKMRVAYCPRGPVFDPARPDALRLLLEAAWRQPGTAMLRFDPYFTESDPRCAVMRQCGCRAVDREWSHWNNPRYVMWLDMADGYDSYFNAMPTSLRTKIRKPEKNGVAFRIGTREDLPAFASLMRRTANSKRIAVHDAEYYALLYETLSREGMIDMFIAEYEGRTVSAGMSIRYGRKAWLMYAASAAEYFKLGANRTLQARMIEWAAQSGCTRYDFRGSATHFPPRADDPGYGVYEFKKSFGPTHVPLTPYYDFAPTALSRLLPRVIDDVAAPSLYRLSKVLNSARSLVSEEGTA